MAFRPAYDPLPRSAAAAASPTGDASDASASASSADPYAEARDACDASAETARSHSVAARNALDQLHDATAAAASALAAAKAASKAGARSGGAAASAALAAGRMEPSEALAHATAQLARAVRSHAAAAEDAEIVGETVDALRSRPVTRFGAVVPAGEIARRAAHADATKARLRAIAAALADVRRGIDECAAAAGLAADGAPAGASTAAPKTAATAKAAAGSGGGFVRTSSEHPSNGNSCGDASVDEGLRRFADEQERAERDATLDRIHAGVKRAGEKARAAREELAEQDEVLGEVEEGVERNMTGLKAAMARTQYILDHSSDKGKICILVVLCLILGVLVAMVITL